MRRSELLLVWLLVGFCLTVGEVCGVTVVSTDVRVWGDWWESWYEDGEDGEPGVWHGTSGEFSGGGGVSDPNQFGSSDVAAGPFLLEMSSYSWPWHAPNNEGGIRTFATVTTVFTVGGSELAVNLSGSADWNYYAGEQDLRVTIRDVVTSDTLLSMAGLDELWLWGGSSSHLLGVDPAHQYELELSGWINAFDAKYAELDLLAELASLSPVTAVPEAGSTFVLLALVLVGLVGRRGQ